MAYQNGLKLRNYLLIKPKEASFSRITFVEFSEEGQKLRESLLFRILIIASAVLQKLLLKIRDPMAKIGDLLESFLNLYRSTAGKVVLPSPIHKSASIVGNLDARVDLDKKITTDDDKYLGALTAMAARLAYESAAYITNVVQLHWKIYFDVVSLLNTHEYCGDLCGDLCDKVDPTPLSNASDYLGTFSTPVFMFQDAKINAKLVVMAFRGTDPFSADGWSTDIDFSYYEIENVGKVHRGFAKALGIIQQDNTTPSQLLLEQGKDGIDLKPYAYYEIVKLLKGILLLNRNAKFIVTGHSLGGALSVMFAAALAMHGQADLLCRVFTLMDSLGLGMNNFEPTWNRNCQRIGGSIINQTVLADAPNKNYFSLIWSIPKLLYAVWELIRSFILPRRNGPEYKEGWFQTLYRLNGILLPGISAHGVQDYVNLTRLGSVPALIGPFDEPIKVLIQP
ncbi:hypothetical protein L484_009551 [Morus notabilis]|uniref:Fungal lipase-type domain-containing protein n=1 Tax=Morus notabilis TaxID=981085 RepID=W9SA43_9ROSA|nr:hypothetical protein L484_009551 [Morus notabilis]